MSPSEWVGIFAVVGAAVTTLIFAQRRNIESLVGQRLDDLQSGVNALNKKSDDHANRLVRVETVLELNGCLGNDPLCGRRQGDR